MDTLPEPDKRDPEWWENGTGPLLMASLVGLVVYWGLIGWFLWWLAGVIIGWFGW